MFKKSMLVALAGVLMLQLTACGTLFYGERKESRLHPRLIRLFCSSTAAVFSSESSPESWLS